MTENTIKIDISDAKVSSDPQHTLATYALGSCIGLCMYDPVAQIGAMFHYLMPNSKENPQQAQTNPFQYADTGMNILLEELIAMGAKKRRLKVTVAGGAEVLDNSTEKFDIGKRNYLAIRKILWKNGMLINAEDVGGTKPRTMYLTIADGSVKIKSYSSKKELVLA